VQNIKYLNIEDCTFTSVPNNNVSKYKNFFHNVMNDSLFWEHMENYSFISNIVLIKCLKTIISNSIFNFSQVSVFAYGNTSLVMDNYTANTISVR
jgi:hypothetical protein